MLKNQLLNYSVPIRNLPHTPQTKFLYPDYEYVKNVLTAIKLARLALQVEANDDKHRDIRFNPVAQETFKAIARAFYKFSRKVEFHSHRLWHNKEDLENFTIDDMGCYAYQTAKRIAYDPSIPNREYEEDFPQDFFEKFLELCLGENPSEDKSDEEIVTERMAKGLLPKTYADTLTAYMAFDTISLNLESCIDMTPDEVKSMRTPQGLRFTYDCALEALQILPLKPKFRRFSILYVTCYDERIRNFFYACLCTGLFDPKARWMNIDFKLPAAKEIETMDAEDLLSLLTFWADKASYRHWSIQRVVDNGDLERAVRRFVTLMDEGAFLKK